jgi:hypothetical protein
VASVALVIIATVAAIVLERMGDLQSELGEMTSSIERIAEIDEIKERLVTLEVGQQIISHAQLSSSISQYPGDAGEYLRMDAVDSIEGSIEFSPRIDATEITVIEDGDYFLFVVPQIQRVKNYSGPGCITFWIAINDKDLANSSIKNCFVDGKNNAAWVDTMTTTLQTILPLHGGDTIRVKMRAQPAGMVGAVAIAPKGVPLVPAVILSLVRLGG